MRPKYSWSSEYIRNLDFSWNLLFPLELSWCCPSSRSEIRDPTAPGCLNKFLVVLQTYFRKLLGSSFTVNSPLRIRVTDYDDRYLKDVRMVFYLSVSEICTLKSKDVNGSPEKFEDLIKWDDVLLLPTSLLLYFARGLVLVLRARSFATMSTVEAWQFLMCRDDTLPLASQSRGLNNFLSRLKSTRLRHLERRSRNDTTTINAIMRRLDRAGPSSVGLQAIRDHLTGLNKRRSNLKVSNYSQINLVCI